MQDEGKTAENTPPRHRAVGYVRTNPGAVKNRLSLGEQRRRILNYVEAQPDLELSLDVNAGIIEDQYRWLTTQLDGRQGGRTLLGLTRRPDAPGLAIVVTEPQILWPDEKSMLSYLEEWLPRGISVHFALAEIVCDAYCEGGWEQEPLYRWTKLARRWQADRSTIKENYRKGTKLNRPYWGCPPFGYKTDPLNAKLIPCQEELETAGMILWLRDDGMTWKEVAAAVNATGRRTQQGKEWKQMSCCSLAKRLMKDRKQHEDATVAYMELRRREGLLVDPDVA